MIAKPIRLGLAVLTLLACGGLAAHAGPTFTYSATDLGNTFFLYSVTIDNTSGTEPLQGVIVFGGDSVFHLDGSSTITSPVGWDFIPPAGSLSDQISYFSTTSASDIPLGASLGGFTFQSMTAPGSLNAGNFQIDVVGSISNTETHAPLVPEPASWLSVTIGALTLLGGLRFRTKRGT